MQYPQDFVNLIIEGDSLEVLPQIPDGSVDLVFADPPFNVGKAYLDSRSDYPGWCAKWIAECFRVLKSTGSFYLKTINRHLQFTYAEMGKRGIFIDHIIWVTSSPLGGDRRFHLDYQPILVYGKTDRYIFDAEAQMIPKTILVTQKVKKAKPDLSTGFMGRIGNIWDDISYINAGCMACAEAILETDSKKKVHPCQMPIALAERAILFSTEAGAVVLDPFVGIGSTAIAAFRNGRDYIGIDVEEEYCRIARERIIQERAQLKFEFV